MCSWGFGVQTLHNVPWPFVEGILERCYRVPISKSRHDLLLKTMPYIWAVFLVLYVFWLCILIFCIILRFSRTIQHTACGSTMIWELHHNMAMIFINIDFDTDLFVFLAVLGLPFWSNQLPFRHSQVRAETTARMRRDDA